MTNQPAMTLEARIAQKLKEDTLGQLVTEDELSEIIKRAMREVVDLRPMIENPKRGYNEPAMKPGELTHIQTWVRDQMQPVIMQFIIDRADELELQKTIELAVKTCLPDIVLQTLTSFIVSNINGALLNALCTDERNNGINLWMPALARKLADEIKRM